MSAFFICAPDSTHAVTETSNCPAPGDLHQAKVKWVYDGDTLKLADGGKLRIIGIDAPEVTHQKQKAEPYGGQATEALRELLKQHGNVILYTPGIRKTDKYGRLLAHVFTPDQTNISSWLLEQGLATSLALPPNDRLAVCYQSNEKNAQRTKKNIWRLSHFQPVSTQELKKSRKGYVRLQGTVKQIKRRKKKLVMRLDRQIYITIKEPELGRFDQDELNNLQGQKVLVTGILYRNGSKGFIRIHHPLYLQRL